MRCRAWPGRGPARPCRISGRSFTLPGLYTPCTLPNDAATENEPIGDSSSYAWSTSSGWVYSLALSALSSNSPPIPSSSPPVTPSSISMFIPSFATRSRMRALSARFHSSGSSERSSMCELNSGTPVRSRSARPRRGAPRPTGRASCWRGRCGARRRRRTPRAIRCTCWAADTAPSTRARAASGQPGPAEELRATIAELDDHVGPVRRRGLQHGVDRVRPRHVHRRDARTRRPSRARRAPGRRRP